MNWLRPGRVASSVGMTVSSIMTGRGERAGTRPVSSLNGKALLTFDEAWGNVRLLVMENKRTSEDLGEGGHGGLVR